MRDPAVVLVACIALGLLSVPLALGRVPPNAYYGFRIAATRASPEAWFRVNRFGGIGMVLASLIGVGLMLAHVVEPLPAFIAPVLVAIGATMVYAYTSPPRR